MNYKMVLPVALAVGLSACASLGVDRVAHQQIVDVGAVPIKREAPKYPMRALKANICGYSISQVYIDKEGKVVDVETVKSWPYSSFGDASETALKKWRYKPAQKEGKPALSWAQIRLDMAVSPASECKNAKSYLVR